MQDYSLDKEYKRKALLMECFFGLIQVINGNATAWDQYFQRTINKAFLGVP
jgi:hypothetical protein